MDQVFRRIRNIHFYKSCIGIILTILLLPYFNQVADVSIPTSLLFHPMFDFVNDLIDYFDQPFCRRLSCFYSFRSKLGNVLKSGLRVTAAGGTLRKSMIVFQFVISVFLIIATIIVVSQLSYIQNKNLGYDKEQIVILPNDSKMKNGYIDFKRALAMQAGVNAVTGAYESPTFIRWSDGIIAETGKEKKEISVNAIPVDFDFIKVMDMQLITEEI